VPQPPDPHALHEATLAKLQKDQQAADAKPPAPTKNVKPARAKPARTPPTPVQPAPIRPVPTQPEPAKPAPTRPARVERTRTRPSAGVQPARARTDNRAQGPEGATGVVGGTTSAIYEFGALVVGICWFVVKWTAIQGTRLVVGMFNAAHWVMSEITGGRGD
jgi:hypothetical protein